MEITVNLDTASVQNAINALKRAKAQLTQMIDEFLLLCCERITILANQNLEWVGIGDLVKEKIKASWEYTVSNGIATVINSYQKAVYVEFGTGVVGEENPHKNAKAAGYDYNVDSPYKDEQGRWVFYANYEDLDLPIEGLSDVTVFRKNNASRMQIRTSGAPASMFVFNAILRFKSEKHAYELWEQIKAKYWG